MVKISSDLQHRPTLTLPLKGEGIQSWKASATLFYHHFITAVALGFGDRGIRA